jgi:hypothetical protein
MVLFVLWRGEPIAVSKGRPQGIAPTDKQDVIHKCRATPCGYYPVSQIVFAAFVTYHSDSFLMNQ